MLGQQRWVLAFAEKRVALDLWANHIIVAVAKAEGTNVTIVAVAKAESTNVTALFAKQR